MAYLFFYFFNFLIFFFAYAILFKDRVTKVLSRSFFCFFLLKLSKVEIYLRRLTRVVPISFIFAVTDAVSDIDSKGSAML